MFIKLILNYTDYNNELIKLLGSSDPELDVKEISRAGELMLYERAYNYLVKLDIKDKYHAKVLIEESNSKLEKALLKILKFYEVEEEYEKCTLLKQYLDFPSFPS